MRFAVLAILACLFFASPNALRPFILLAALVIFTAAGVELWQDMSRTSKRRTMLTAQIRGYAADVQSTRRSAAGRRLG